MPSLPNEIFSNITNFLPNNDITDLMLLSRKFNALVTPRLKEIDQEMTTMNQSIESFMPVPEPTGNEWISQLNLRKFEPISSEAKSKMKEVFANREDCLARLSSTFFPRALDRLKERMSLERFDNTSFGRILGALVSMPKFRQEYNVSLYFAHIITRFVAIHSQYYPLNYSGTFKDVERIWSFYNPNCSLSDETV